MYILKAAPTNSSLWYENFANPYTLGIVNLVLNLL